MRNEPWHSLPASDVAAALRVDQSLGLDAVEADARRRVHGSNVLEERAAVTWPRVLARQFLDVLVAILLAAAFLSIAIGELGDALTIFAIVILNGVLGFAQEWRAERAMRELRRMLSPRCRVLRAGVGVGMDAAQLVPGDVIELDAGDRVPADLRLVTTVELTIDESALTGESVPVPKGPAPVAPDAALSERSSLAFTGTAVTTGRAVGLVVATGVHTAFGHIAELTRSVEREETPLQRQLASLGRQLGVLSLVVALLVTLAGWIAGEGLLDMFMTGVALAVAVVPEGLPAVVTVTLAIGLRAMLRRRVLIRRLQASETLGETTVVCTDKTGTLTRNEMTATHVWLAGGAVDVTGVGYDPAGHFERLGERVDYAQRQDLLRLLRAGLECNNARLYEDAARWEIVGEPTEAALLTLAYKAWLNPAARGELLAEYPFDSSRKRMSRVLRAAEGAVSVVKGAPEVVVARCARILHGDEERDLTDADRERVEAVIQELGGRGLRTLALADRRVEDVTRLTAETAESELTLLGIVGIIDPPRTGVAEAIRSARSAGVRPIMITGDAVSTALATARKIGLPAERGVTGSEVQALDAGGLAELLANEGLVFARTTPEHKLRIVEALQSMGHVVGMTGDGVNDAPALKRADVGIAMGLRGTEVARGAADMILTDDDFASIVGGIEEGRRQRENIEKFVRYLLSANAGEVFAIMLGILLGSPLALLPVQILWMNLVTDGLSALALGLEPPEGSQMDRPPRRPGRPLLGLRAFGLLLLLGALIGLATQWLFQRGLRDGTLDYARTMAFTGLVVIEKVNVLNFRSLRSPLAVIGLCSNPWLLAAILLTVGLQMAAIYVPFLQEMLHTVPLSPADWLAIAAVALPFLLGVEAIKWLRHRSSGSERD